MPAALLGLKLPKIGSFNPLRNSWGEGRWSGQKQSSEQCQEMMGRADLQTRQFPGLEPEVEPEATLPRCRLLRGF